VNAWDHEYEAALATINCFHYRRKSTEKTVLRALDENGTILGQTLT
jgi:hypothetical protein